MASRKKKDKVLVNIRKFSRVTLPSKIKVNDLRFEMGKASS